MRLFVRLSLIGLVILVGLGFGLKNNQTQASSTVVTEGACGGSGTSLVIDFGTKSSKPLITKCVDNYSGSSWNLLKSAGLVITGTEKYPTGFLCRINGFPDQSQEPCKDTPGVTNGSWAYFLADSGSWVYSPYGAATHKAKCGISEGWRFLAPEEPLNTFPRFTPTKYSCEK